MLRLNIKRIVKNENFEAEKKQFNEKRSKCNSFSGKFPEYEKEILCLDVKITEKQFEEIRKKVLKIFLFLR